MGLFDSIVQKIAGYTPEETEEEKKKKKAAADAEMAARAIALDNPYAKRKNRLDSIIEEAEK